MEKLTKTITIGVTADGRCAVNVSKDMDATLALQLTGTLALHLLNAFKSVAASTVPKDDKDYDTIVSGITDSLYDAADSVFSNILLQFNPKHPRYTIEDEAILELVNSKIEEKYNSLTKEEKSKYHQAYNKLRLQAEFRAKHTASNTPDVTDLNSGDKDEKPKAD